MKTAEITLGELMNASVRVISPEMNLESVARSMATTPVSCLVIAQDDHLLGILTERDMVRMLRNHTSGEVAVAEVMSSPVITAHPSDTFRDGLMLMREYALRHLVLVDEVGKVQGIVSESDLRTHLGFDLVSKVRDLQSAMDRKSPALDYATALPVALDRMIAERWDYVVVTRDGKPCGIFTERDVPRLLSSHADIQAVTLEQVMSSPLVTIAQDQPLQQAAELMSRHRLRHLVVIDGQGELAGVLSQHGLMDRIGLEFIGDSLHELEALRAQSRDRERALVERQEIYGAIVDQAADSIVLIDVQTLKFSEFNARAHESLGYSREEFSRLTLPDLQGELDAAEVRRRVQANVAQANYASFEIMHRRKDGSLRTTRVSSRPVTIRGRSYLAAIWSDMTERKQAEMALRSSEQQFRSVFEQAAVGISIVSPQAQWLQVNQRLCNILGYSREALMNLSFRDITPLPTLGDDLVRVQRMLDGETDADSWEKQYIRKDGKVIWVRITTSLVRDAAGAPSYFVTVTEDIHESKLAQQALRKSEERFRATFNHAGMGIAIVAVEGQFLQVNERFCRLVGYGEQELLRKTFQQITYPEDLQEDMHHVAQLHTGAEHSFSMEKRYIHKSGVPVWVNLTSTLVRDEHGAPQYYVAVVEDISLRKRADEQLRLAASVFLDAREGIMITDANGVILQVNDAFIDITGYDRAELAGMTPRVLKSGRHDREFYEALWQQLRKTEHWSGELWNKRKDGSLYAEQLSISAIRDAHGVISHYVGIFADITEHKRQQEQIERLAFYDALTRLPNRVLLADRMRQALARADRADKIVAVCYLDLDGFKPINDRYGHKAGDSVLVEIAARLQDFVRAEDTVARLGGDEFVLLLTDLESESESEGVLSRLLEIVTQPCRLHDDISVSVSVSIGVTFYPTDHNDTDMLLRHADQAMYQAKQMGRNRKHFFDPHFDLQARKLHELKTQVRYGLEHGDFTLYWQPKLDLTQGHVVGAEALLRWRQPDASIMLPGAFLPQLEDDDLIVELGDYVIHHGVEMLRCWRDRGLDMSISVNVAARQLLAPDFVDKLRAALSDRPDLAPYFELEIVETAALNDLDRVKQIIVESQALGVKTALDDFGTGYSSMTYLRRIPVNTVKVDQSFVRDMLNNEDDLAIVHGILGLTKAFNKVAVAEGVEREEHLLMLHSLGCEVAQGYVIGYPMPETEFLNWMEQYRPNMDWARRH